MSIDRGDYQMRPRAFAFAGTLLLTVGITTTVAAPASGQARNVTGVVRDSASGEALPSASIVVIGTAIRASTDSYIQRRRDEFSACPLSRKPTFSQEAIQ
jgi:hypothetical protein